MHDLAMSLKTIYFIGAGLCFATICLLFVAGCGSTSKSVPKQTASLARSSEGAVLPPARATPAGAEYAGNEACAPCHAIDFKLHKSSGHNLTMHFMDREGVGDTAPPVGKIQDTNYVIEKKEGEYLMKAVNFPDSVGKMNVSMGSGNTGITYLGISENYLAEAQMSYFPKLKKWYLTPGHDPQSGPNLGMVYSGEVAKKCVFCHSTKMEEDTLIPERKFVGVGCEACHGPGSLHIAAMKAGKFSEGKMISLEKVGAKEVLKVCEQCHRPKPGATMNTSRQTLVGILKSRCYLESKDTFSCISCHNPHTNVSHDIKKYESICLSCHSASDKPLFKEVATIRGKICPVNSKDQCIRCHMPPGPAFENTATPTKFADHLIRVHKELSK